MDLWIRSQDKLNLTKVRNIWIEKSGQYYGIFDDSVRYYIGMYETKERALEVLDEIQSLIIKSSRVMVHTPVKNKEIESAFDADCCGVYIESETPIIYPINQQCMVYEMPQE